MAKPGPTVKSGSGNGISVTTTTETICCSVQVTVDNPNPVILLEGNIDITLGASVTALTVTIRRGPGLGGAIVGVQEVPTTTASTRIVVPYQLTDTPGEVAGQVYTMTVTQGGATTNGTINSSSLTATY